MISSLRHRVLLVALAALAPQVASDERMALAQPGGGPAAVHSLRTGAVGLTVAEMAKQAESKLGEMRGAVKRGFETLGRARQSSDIPAMSCINVALTAMKGLVRLAEQNYVTFQEIVAQGDSEAAEREFVKIATAHEKVLELDSQVSGCSEPDMTGEFEGRPRVEVSVDGDTGDEPDGDEWLSGPEVILVVPSTASPYF